MRADTIAFMALRILALWTGVAAVRVVGQIIGAPGQEPIAFAGPALMAVAAALLWAAADALSHRLVRPSEDETSVEDDGAMIRPQPTDHEHQDEAPQGGIPDPGPVAVDVLRVVVSLMAVWTLLEGVLNAATAVATALVTQRPDEVMPNFVGFFAHQVRWAAAAALVQLVVGTIVLLAAGRIASWIAGSWTQWRGVVRARRIELRDEVGDVRATLGMWDEPDGGQVAALTLFDAELRPRLRAVADAGSRIEVLDEAGSSVWRAPQ